MKYIQLFIKKNLYTFLVFIILFTFTFTLLTGCFGEKREPLTEENIEEIPEEDTPEETENLVNDRIAEYADIFIDNEDFVDPYPLRTISITGNNKLTVVDESNEADGLEAFVVNLKDAVDKKDSQKLLKMTSDNISYSFGANLGKEGFITHWNLDSDPNGSELWPILERLLPWGGSLEYADQYVIPYVFPRLTSDSPNGVVIGEYVNLRQEPSTDSQIIEALNYDFIDIEEFTDKTYTIEGIDYNWLKIKSPSGNRGYIVSKFVYYAYDYRIGIALENGIWKITYIIAGD